jgi:hypothetical protein
VLSAARQGGDFNALLPSAAQGHAKLQRARFQAVGSGRLMVVFDGEIQVSSQAAVAFIEELRAGDAKAGGETVRESAEQSAPR